MADSKVRISTGEEKEVWEPVPGYDYVMASSMGRIKTLRRTVPMHGSVQVKKETIRNPKPNRIGYIPIKLDRDDNGVKEQALAHRLVAAAFFGESELEVNHKNGIKHDNRIENLEYVTRQENCLHALRENLYDHATNPCVAIDTRTGKKYKFPSQKKCAGFFRVTSGAISYHIGRGSRLKNRFRIRPQSDFDNGNVIAREG